MNKYYPVRSIVFFFGEGGLIFFSLFSVTLAVYGFEIFRLDMLAYCIQCFIVTVVFQICLYFFDLYDQHLALNTPELVTRISQAFGIGCIVLGLIYYSLPFLIVATDVFWLSCIMIVISLLLWRGGYLFILRKGLFVQKILLVGTGKQADLIAGEAELKIGLPYKIVACIRSGDVLTNLMDITVYDSFEQVEKANVSFERIVVALDNRRGNTPIEGLLKYKMSGVEIEQGTSFYEKITGKVPVERINPSWIIFSDGFHLSRLRYFVKRFMDVSLSLILLVLALPVVLVSAVIIKLESKGPVFYCQDRVGEKNRVFRIIKFRSMCDDAEKGGAVWASVDDDRVTIYGKIMRKSRIDEIPQLINVLKGDLSMVGPRPERPVFVEQLVKEVPYYGIRHEVRPGVTGWAQVCYPYGASVEDALRKLEYDLYYMKNISIGLDLLILFKTVKTVLFQHGGR